MNLHPLSGERDEYYPEYPERTSEPVEDYALVFSIGGGHGRGQAGPGQWTQHETNADGLEYLTDPATWVFSRRH